VARLARGEERDHVCDVLGLGDLAERGVVDEELHAVLGDRRRVERGVDEAGRHGERGDAPAAVLPRDGLRHRHDAGLGGRVVPVIGVLAAPGCAAGEVDDDAPAGLLAEARDRRAAERGRRDEADRERALPRRLPGREVVVGPGRLVDARVVYEDVDVAAPREGLVPERVRGRRVAQIRRERVGRVAELVGEL
jgi:hypothetical protein